MINYKVVELTGTTLDKENLLSYWTQKGWILISVVYDNERNLHIAYFKQKDLPKDDIVTIMKNSFRS